jgi:hypothetical protein
MGKKSNVVALTAKKDDQQAERVKLAERYVEAMCKDNPSQEIKEWFQGVLGRDPKEWRKHGDLMKEAIDKGLEKFYLGYVTKESVKHGAELLKEELGHADASPIEKLLIEQAVLSHIRLGMVEHLYSRQLAESYSLAQGAHWEMRLTLCQRRYMKAITTLQKVRVMLARVPDSIQRPGEVQALAKRA